MRPVYSRIASLIGLLTAVGGALAGADSAVTFGVNADLVAGAEALQRGRYEEGITRTQAGLDTFVTRDQRAAALSNLCAGYTALGKYDIAVVHCSASLELDPGWQAYNNRALAYLGKGLIRLAGRDCAEGLVLNPDSEQLLRVKVLVEEAGRRRNGRGSPDPSAHSIPSSRLRRA
jgi:tetratricopeptide (TPR) repeat protein